MDTSPPLLGNDDLPGPMCLNLLASSGALCKLDSANAYSSHDSDTLYGRACIIATLLPSRSVACARTAAWVWLGGTFPDSIDIIAKAHFRSNDCMQIMEDAKHIRNAPQARNYILAIDGRGYEHGNRKDCEDRKNRKDAEYVRGA